MVTLDILSDLANILEQFLKGLSECSLLTTYSIQLQATSIGFAEQKKFWYLMIQFVKCLQLILLKVPKDDISVEFHDISTQTCEDLENDESSFHNDGVQGQSVCETWESTEEICHLQTHCLLSHTSPSFKTSEIIIGYPSTTIAAISTQNISVQRSGITVELVEAFRTTSTDINIEVIKSEVPLCCNETLVDDNNETLAENSLTAVSLVDDSDASHEEEFSDQSLGCLSLNDDNKDNSSHEDVICDEHPKCSDDIAYDKEDTSLDCVCNICQKAFSTSSLLDLHSSIHKQTRECDLCSLKFSSLQNLQEHCRVEHGGTGCFFCSACDRRFMSKLSYKRHIDIHDGKKRAVCDVCGKAFRRTDYLQKHHMTHTGHKPFECTFCEKRFVSSSQLKIHTKIHSGVKEYVCDICKKAFNRSDKLKEHTLRHFNIKRFQCTICLKDYAEKRDLKKHLKLHDSENNIQKQQGEENL